MDAIEDAVGRSRASTATSLTYSEQTIRDVGALDDGDEPTSPATASTS